MKLSMKRTSINSVLLLAAALLACTATVSAQDYVIDPFNVTQYFPHFWEVRLTRSLVRLSADECCVSAHCCLGLL